MMYSVGPNANPQSISEEEGEDLEVRRSSSPASSAPRRRGRHLSETVPVVSQPASTRNPQRRPAKPVKRRHYVEYSGSDSDVGEATPPPAPPHVGRATRRQAAGLAKDYTATIFGYIAEVVAGAFHHTRWFFSLALGVIIMWFLCSTVISRLVYLARPMCSLPIVSPIIPFCRWEVFKGLTTHTAAGRSVRWADYPKLVDLQTRTFDQLLDESVGSKGLALEVKKAEMANNDLITLVRVSDLKSKDQIAERLSKFSDDARGTGRSLHSLWAKTKGAIDS